MKYEMGINNEIEEPYDVWENTWLVRFSIFYFWIVIFNKNGVMAEDIPTAFYPFSLPATIIGIILMLSSHFFKKKNV
ncbi:hypothetical protein OBCHQ24_15700 [Oceanobacillus iheyensis]|nr:hypothetical protein OBCHQ24_15700 [Oceanobacillus iheyensis]